MLSIINIEFQSKENEIKKIISEFGSSGVLFCNGDRNVIKLFNLNGMQINVKSFKIPHLINKIAYKYFRKSKARRSFEYASILLEKGIGTPKPIAYFENRNAIGIKESFYVSQHLEYDLTFRELVELPDYPDHSAILSQFVRFTFELHEKGIEFLDHSSGNTLIQKKDQGNYDFFLVDLNRMNFHQTMNFNSRMKNLSHLTPKKEMVAMMSKEYSKLYKDQNEAAIFEKMWFYTKDFQERFAKKKRLKKILKFWKKY